MKTYIHHTDPGHGWVAVKRKELVELGIMDKITNFSYQSKSGQTIYLEEDADATLFHNTYLQKYGIAPNYRTSYKNRSPIRSMFKVLK